MGGIVVKSVQELDDLLATPSDELVQLMRRLEGDILILGVGGKMGPSLAERAQQAIRAAGVSKQVIGVSRFSDPISRQTLESHGIRTIAADLMDDQQIKELPDVANVIYMVGHKFGTVGREYVTWAMNTYLPGRVAEHFRRSRIVAFSSGNVYPLSPVRRSGNLEKDEPAPIGDYAQSCLGRERILEFFSRKYDTSMLLFRLNYAIDMRYGVLLEVASAVQESRPIDLSTGHVNVIWQGDANDVALRALEFCSNPPTLLNVTGPETISVRWLAQEFGKLLGKTPIYEGQEMETALLSNAAQCYGWFGYPHVTLRNMIDWTAEWVGASQPMLGKPTHFQEREGRF